MAFLSMATPAAGDTNDLGPKSCFSTHSVSPRCFQLPGEGAAFGPGATQMVCVPWGWHVAGVCFGHTAFSQHLFGFLCSVYASHAEDTGASWSGRLLVPSGEVLSLPQPWGTSHACWVQGVVIVCP